MKPITIGLLILSCFGCLAEDTNIIVATDWSKPVTYDDHSVRGRLIIVRGSQPAYGGPQAEKTNHSMMFVELQNTTEAVGVSVKFYFDTMGLNCELSSNGIPVGPAPRHAQGGGREHTAKWIVLPYNSTIRLFINTGTVSPLTLHQSGDFGLYWEILSTDTNAYSLTASLAISTPANATLTAIPHRREDPHEYAEWKGTLAFPKVKVSDSMIAKQN